MSKKLKKIKGWASWKLKSTTVEAHVTETGGHLAPVTFDRKGKKICPYSVAPWCKDKIEDEQSIIQVLRGDFFCLPFGGNDTPYRGEQYPIHGDTANRKWKFVDCKEKKGVQTLHLRMKTKARKGQVDKQISLADGQNVIYSSHVISGMSGKMPLGHHATLKFPDAPGSGLISTSRIKFGQVFVEPTENPEEKGYSILKPGAVFKDMTKVPMITGENTDLSVFPARRGFEDIAILIADPRLSMAWTAVSYPEHGYVWFGLKDPKVLAATLMWMSNGGRHYSPWNGRHVNVMGLEEVTSFFHVGLKESLAKNCLSVKGVPTALPLSPQKPTTVNYIMGCVPTPKGFDRVKSIRANRAGNSITITSENGKNVQTAVNIGFLQNEE